jgi:hypothetical protein
LSNLCASCALDHSPICLIGAVFPPSEKYVTRAEYDELKARFDHLEAAVSQLFAASPGAVTVPPFQMGMHPGMPGTGSLPSYQGPPGGQVVYHHPMMSPSNFQHLDASQATPRYPKLDSPSSPRHQPPPIMPPPPSTVSSGSALGPPSARPRGPQDMKSPQSSAGKQYSPLSLSSITSPFNPDPQSKNCHAQTLKLGERLRPRSQAHEDPVTICSGSRRTRRHQRRLRTRPTYFSTRRLPRRSRCPRLRLGASVILPSFCPVSDPHEMTIETA